MKTKTIAGIYTPNIIPYNPDHSLNEGELRRYVSWLIEKGVSGLYPNGSTGEFIRLSFEERIRVVEIVADETGGRVPILAGAAEPNIDLVLEACARYADLGCRAVSVTGPYYYKVSQESIESYFRKLAEQSPIDIVIYNIPQFSNEVGLETVRRLAMDCPRIVGTKDSSRDMPRFMDTVNEVKAQRPDFACLIGCEEILLPSLLMGGDGGTIATSGVAPEAIMKLFDCFQGGDLKEAKRIQFKLLELIKTMFAAGNFPEGFRAGVALRGFEVGRTRHPLGEHEQRHLEDIRSRLACLLADCGYEEAAAFCQCSQSPSRPGSRELRDIVREVVKNYQGRLH